MRRPGRRRTPARPPGMAAGAADRRRPLGRPGDPALARRARRTARRDLRPGRHRPPPRRRQRGQRPSPGGGHRRRPAPRPAQRPHPRGDGRTHPRHAGRPRRGRVLPRGVGRHRRQPLRDRRTPREGPGQRIAARRGGGRRTARPEPLRPRRRSRRPPGATRRRLHPVRLGRGHPRRRHHRRHGGQARHPGPRRRRPLRRAAPGRPDPGRARRHRRTTVRGRPGVRASADRTAVYNSIPDALRTAMHGIAAQLVTDSGLGAAAASRHLLKVHPDDDQEVVAQLREAAREHLAVGAPDAARRCLERALREPPLPESHARVLFELGCATLLTAPATTIGHLRTALAMPGLEGEQRVDAVFRLSQALLHNDQLEEAVRTVEAEAARNPDPSARLRLQAAQYMWEGIHAGETSSPHRSARLAELAATCTGRDNAERALLILRGFDAMTHGESAEEVVELCDRALVNGRLAPGLGWTDTEWGLELPMMLASSYAYADRLDRAEALFTEALRAYESAGWSGGHLSLAHAYVGLGHRRRGRLRDAEQSLRESLRIAERVGRGLPLYWSATCNLIDTLLARGHVEEARTVAEQYGFAPPYPSTIVLPDPRPVRARLLLATGRTKEGINELEAAEKAAAARGRHNPVVVPWATELARALAGEDPGRAARLATDARRQAERFGTDTAIGEALRCAAALETGQRAVRLAAQAATYLEASPCQYEHAAARVEYGIAARSAAELNRGLALAESCGADGLAARAREALAVVGRAG
ncbi:regulatory protein [Streptomyces lividans TK24]|nr:regulatory protein [Streptomyces lividans TK24]